MLKELVNEKDDIVVELNLKKLSDNFNIDLNHILFIILEVYSVCNVRFAVLY